MKEIVCACVSTLILLVSDPIFAQRANMEHPVWLTRISRVVVPLEWKSCAVTSDCISISRGCHAWIILNKNFIDKYPVNVCTKSSPGGPKPAIVCKDRVCVPK